MAANKLAVLETYLKDILFSQEQITKDVEVRDHIFEIKDSENSLGFISLYDLKAYVYEHEDEAKNYYVRNIDSSDWILIYEHPYFQRRKPQLVSSGELKNEDDLEFFILIKGQKTGPYEKYELMDKLDNKELLLSDMVTFNGGATWIKLFQIDGFDRRTLKVSSQLPGMPSEALLQRPNERINEMDEDTDAISSLAYLGNLKLGKSIERQREDFLEDEMMKNASSSTKYKWLLISSVIAIIYLIYNIKTNLNTPVDAGNTKTIGEQAEMLSPTDQFNSDPTAFEPNRQRRNRQNTINNQARSNNNKFQRRVMAPVRVANRKSFMDSKNYKDNSSENASENSGEDGNYFYDNAAPMELDPVRSQISRENFDNGAEPTATPSNDPIFSQELSD